MALDMGKVAKSSWVWLEITQDEYDKLTKNLDDVTIKKNFKITYQSDGYKYHMKSTPEINELLIALNYENNKILMSMRETLFSIQSMLKYFYVMSIIGLILLVIFILIYVFRLFGN